MNPAAIWIAALVSLGCAGPAAMTPRHEEPAAARLPSAQPSAPEPGLASEPPAGGTEPAAPAERPATEGQLPPRGTGPFPRPAALAALSQRPLAEKVFTEAAEEVDGWVLFDAPAGPPPLGEHAPKGPWDARLSAWAATRPGAVRLTEPMSCLARQVGEFALLRKLRPGPAMLAFMSSRCGVTESVGMAMVSLQLQGGETDEELEALLAGPFARQLKEMRQQGRLTAGAWYGRAADRALVMLITAEPLARLESFPGRPGPDGRVVVRGEVLRPAARLSALVTRGPYGYASCDLDPKVALPRFSVSCPLDPSDDTVTLEVAAFGPRRIFGPVVVSAELWPHGDPPPSFVPPMLVATLGGPVQGDLPATLAGLVDGVRRDAGLPALALAIEQSETAKALAPHFFAAAAKHDDAAMETIVLGLRAGWQVPGTVRAGLFTSARSDDLLNAGRLLSVALSRPSGRETLLNPEAKSLAIGTLREEGGLGAIFATYALIDPSRGAAEAQAFLDRLDGERFRRGLGKSEAYPALTARVTEIALAIERGGSDPNEAVTTILPRAAKPDPALGFGTLYSWIGAGERIEAVPIPAALLEARSLRVAVAVAHCRLEGSPWAEYCVVLGALVPK